MVSCRETGWQQILTDKREDALFFMTIWAAKSGREDDYEKIEQKRTVYYIGNYGRKYGGCIGMRGVRGAGVLC